MKSKPVGSEPVSKADLAFAAQRLRLELHNLVLEAFERERVSQSELALRLRKQPSQISRLMAAPGNWTLDTAAHLLYGISGNVVEVTEHDISAAPVRNDVIPDLLLGQSAANAPKPKAEGVVSGASAPKVQFQVSIP
ncbi:hypothetical protein [Tabrizicola sp.]